MNKLTLAAETSCLETLYEFIASELNKTDCPEKTRMRIQIAAEEIFTNIAQYAYARPGSVEVCIEFDAQHNRSIMTFIDEGVPFDPTTQQNPDTSLSADERSIGGLGIFMAKNIMTTLEYRRAHNKNILVATKQH